MNRDLWVWTSEDCALVLIAALDTGDTLIDTGDFYGTGHNGLLIARALKGRDRDSLLLSVKFGALRDPTGGWGPYDGRPAAVKSFLAYSPTRLGTDHIDIYRPARLDPQVPIVETVGARRRERLHEALGASGLELSPADLERIEAAVPAGAAAGSRYAEFLMGELDGERSAA
jgi:aryl-alcohol dehydrogenase-like predicted oxidoreductase